MSDIEETQGEVALDELVGELEGASRRRRQDAAHRIALLAKADPEQVAPYVSELVDALERPEAQTRWEALGALAELAPTHADEVAAAFDGAEQALFDEGSAMVRLGAFVFLSRLAATSPARSDQVWPLLDEAVQCYHGDAEYRDMLAALLSMATGSLSDATKASLKARVSFDAERGSGYMKTYSSEIVQALA